MGGLIDIGGGMGDSGGSGTVGTPVEEEQSETLPEAPTNDDASPGDTPDLDLGDANPGAGVRNDSEEAEGIVVDSDPSDPGGGQTIISDGADGDGSDESQQDLADQARDATSGGRSVPSGVVDSDSGEYVDTDTDGDSSSVQSSDDGTAGFGDIPTEALAAVAVLALLLFGGGSA